jgi:hypothetical protein
MILADLIQGKQRKSLEFSGIATATVATLATLPLFSPSTVATVATVAVANSQKTETTEGDCRTCVHLRKPGRSDGHCVKRADLPPAYGEGHPLRQCPEDGGASCREWRHYAGG